MCVIVRALRVILPEVSGMTGTLSTCTHPGASLSYEVTGAPYPSLIFSPMNSRMHHASSGALDFGSVHTPYRSERKEYQHLGLPDNAAGAIPPGRVPLQLSKHRRCVPDKFRSRRAIFVPFLDSHFAWQMPRPIDSGSEICCAFANLATPTEEPT